MGQGTRGRRRTGAERGIRVRALGTIGALIIGGGGLAVAMNVGGGSAPARPEAAATPPTRIDNVDLTADSSGRTGLSARATAQFNTVGVTWNSATTTLHGAVQIRTRAVTGGTWSGWRTLSPEDSAPTQAANGARILRGGTSPMWVGAADGVEVRIRSAKGTTALPAGMKLTMIDTLSGRGAAPVGYAMDATSSDSATATDSAGATDSSSASGTAGASPTDSPTTPGGGSSASDSSSPSASDSATAGSSASAPGDSSSATSSPSGSASASASATPSAAWPAQLPTLAQAYPNCPASSGSPTPAAPAAPSPMPTQTSSPIPMPPIITRAGWAADECVRETGYPSYSAQVKVVFVHHTDDSNNYTCAQSAALVRAAYAYHVKTEGWRDIGYNFLVDKCGQIFEGRFGGVTLPVLGAQTYGMNTNSMGIAALGTYTDLTGGDSTASTNPGATPTDSMLRSIAWIAAWKLGMYGYSPTGTNPLVEGASDSKGFTLGQTVSLSDISGHRNGFATDCPGNQLYNALGTIRAYAANPITAIDGGAFRYNSAYWLTRDAATVHWATATPTASIAGFDVLVDGVVRAQAGASANSAALSGLANGTHQVVVRTRLVAGGSVSSAAAVLRVDKAAPTFPAPPALSLRTGAVSTTAVPVLLNWRAADDVALATVAATAPTASSFATTSTAWYTYAKPGSADLFAIRATDLVGNAGTTSVTRTPTIVQETATTRTGTWARWANSVYLGGASYAARTAGASISWTFTGSSVAFVATKATYTGQAYVYVDGVKVGSVDTYASSTQFRQAVWTRTWSTSGRHVLKIVVVGTAGRPTVAADGIVVLN